MPYFEDQLHRKISLSHIPQRIVSLVPSQTELLYHLGLDKEVIGITKFCVHPNEWFRTKTRIGGTKLLNIEKIRSLQPDLIIANKEENVQEQIEVLVAEFPVWVSNVVSLPTAYEMMLRIGLMVGKKNEALQLVVQLQQLFHQYRPERSAGIRTAYLIWKDPYMTVGGDTFIHEMLAYNGLINVFADNERYPEISVGDLMEKECALILLSSEPYPFKQKHVDELKSQFPDTKILLADGEFFSWYGSRLLYASAYFQQLRKEIHSM